MYSFIEVLDKLEVLRGYDILSTSNKLEIELIYRYVFGKNFVKTSCNDCYHDAVIEMYLHLKKTGKMKEKSSYMLKNGTIIQAEFGSNTMYTNSNITDEAAENYLADNPEGIIYFASVPADWENRVKKRMVKRESIDNSLLEIIIESLDSGVSEESIQIELSSYIINGRKVTEKQLKNHISKAKESLELKKSNSTFLISEKKGTEVLE